MTQSFITPPFWFALIAALAFAGVAFALKLLSKSGAVATAILGGVVFGGGGGYFMVPLLVFFLTSSLLSKIGRDRKANANKGDFKGSVRDAAQVFANGGVAGTLVLIYALTVRHSDYSQSRLLLIYYLAAIAAANADTWATEIGKFSLHPPRFLRDWKTVAPGTSGAISLLGTFGAALGAILIPLSALPFWHLNLVELITPILCGFFASLVDSVLGATLQGVYEDPTTGEITESPELAGKEARPVRGFRLLNNDGVNFLSCLAGAFLCWLITHFAILPYQ